MKLVSRRLRAHACKVFSILRGRLAPHGIAHPCLRHQLAFIAAIGKHLRRPALSILRGDRDNPGSLALHAIVLAQPFVQVDLHVRIGQQGAENLRVHVRL